jgi:ABC-type dipeptide/oligopeptide/nickel transport systems, permease components
MLRYVIRRILLAIPTLIGVLLLTFFLFFGLKNPEVIARQNLGKNPTQAQIQQWLADHGYDKPLAEQLKRSTVDMLLFNFGQSDTTGEEIKERIKKGAGPSLTIQAIIFATGLTIAILIAVLVAYFRGTYVDRFGTLLTVVLISIVYVTYIIGLQYYLGKRLQYGPVWGFNREAGLAKFILIPVVIGVVAGIGASIRLYRTFLLDEINQDYVRTARAKGVPEGTVLLRHVLKNAMIPILTTTVATIPTLILGGLLLENFFGIPGLGGYLIDAITNLDFAVVRAMVFLGTLLTLIGYILTDIAYALVDPRVRLE